VSAFDCIAPDGCPEELHAAGRCRRSTEHAHAAWGRLYKAARAVSIEALRNTGPSPSAGETTALDELSNAAIAYGDSLRTMTPSSAMRRNR
jgi:hypothetical protein